MENPTHAQTLDTRPLFPLPLRGLGMRLTTRADCLLILEQDVWLGHMHPDMTRLTEVSVQCVYVCTVLYICNSCMPVCVMQLLHIYPCVHTCTVYIVVLLLYPVHAMNIMANQLP